jgi:hypothetical protein
MRAVDDRELASSLAMGKTATVEARHQPLRAVPRPCIRRRQRSHPATEKALRTRCADSVLDPDPRTANGEAKVSAHSTLVQNELAHIAEVFRDYARAVRLRLVRHFPLYEIAYRSRFP